MDLHAQLHVPTSTETPSFWTDEKHLHYLNTMEASFVRAMLENHNHQRRRLNSPPLLRLDRDLPDSLESTLDSKPQRTTRKNHTPSSPSQDLMEGRRRRRRRSCHLYKYKSSEDQVVPQIENGRKVVGTDNIGDENEVAEK